MNSRQCAEVQGLIFDFDNTRVAYARLRPLLIRPHLKFLIERVSESHAAIADALAAHMDRTGGLSARRGDGALARLRARIEGWIAISNVDVELGCLKRVARHEARITQRFRATLDRVQDLHPSLHRELRELERARFRIESWIRDIEMPPLAVPRRAATVTTFSSHERSGK